MNTREINMEKRRQRILSEARRTIEELGFQGLNTRALAKAAGVSQPTLYNLIGSKDQILLLLINDTMDIIESRLSELAPTTPLAQLEALAEASVKLFSKDEGFYRPAFIANELFSDQQKVWGKEGRLMLWANEIGITAFKAAQKQGLLKGNIPAKILGAHMFESYRVCSRDWAFRLIPIEEFRVTVLQSTYIHLAADAEEDFHRELMKKIKRLGKPKKR